MLTMLANNTGWDAGVLYGRYPQFVGHLYSPGAGRKPNFMPPYALDNGRFAAQGKDWDEAAFWRLLETHGKAARWMLPFLVNLPHHLRTAVEGWPWLDETLTEQSK